MAGFTRLLPRNLNRRFHAFGGFLEGDLQVVAKIGSALRTAPAACIAEQISESEHVPEDVGEVAELVEYGRIKTSAAPRGRTNALMSEAIVETSFFGIAEDRVRFSGLFEPFL